MIDYEENWLVPLLFKLEGSVYWRSAYWSLPASGITVALVFLFRQYPDLTEDTVHSLDLASLSKSHLWTALTAVLAFMVTFRTKQGLARFWEGTGLLHQMKGEWFDTVSNCVTFTIGSGADDSFKVQGFRHTIVRLMSLCHASALEEIASMGSQMETIDVLGLNSATLRHLKDCVENHKFNKVEVLLHLVQSLITNAHHEGILRIPPPILSRVYQTISRGYVHLLNTKKITDTKFPFPYVQLITLLLILHTILTPLVVAVSVDSLIIAPIVAFIPVFGTHSMNFIAMELEDPFGMDDNDLPLKEFQAEMNNCLLMLLHPNTDLIAGINADRCVIDFYDLKNSIYPSRGFDDEACPRDAQPVTAKLFDPNFRIMSTNQDLEAAAAGIFGEEDDEANESEIDKSALQDLAQQGTGAESYGKAGPLAMPFDEDAHQAAGSVPASFEPKFSAGKGGPLVSLQQTKELEGLLSKSMEDFSRSLQCWTKTMEDQVQELSHGFSNLNELVNGSAKARTAAKDVQGAQHTRPPDGSRHRGGGNILQPTHNPTAPKRRNEQARSPRSAAHNKPHGIT